MIKQLKLYIVGDLFGDLIDRSTRCVTLNSRWRVFFNENCEGDWTNKGLVTSTASGDSYNVGLFPVQKYLK